MGSLLVPRILGQEVYEIDELTGATALTGTGFDIDNPQHVIGSDAVRWAIALRQLRDQKDFAALDLAKVQARKFFQVNELADRTVLFRKITFDGRMPIWDGILMDE